MLVLVLYTTVEGQTAKISRHVADQIESAGHEVIVTDVRQPGFAVPGRFDAVFVCGPIHNGHYPQPLVQFVKDFKAALDEVPNALITVSLSIASQFEDEREIAKGYPYELSKDTGWIPAERHDAAGALKYLEYNYFKTLLMRQIAAHAGAPVNTRQDSELTDWEALDRFVSDFLASNFR
ncbi:MAG: flavodoxin domain-containing protein [Burkholderiaceae bacterium]